jgi:hypothetical protein
MNIKQNERHRVISFITIILVGIVLGFAANHTIEISIESDEHVEVEKHEKFTPANHFKRK